MGSLPIGLSASRGAAILGMSKWATPFSVWQQIMETMKPGFNAERGYEYIPFEGNNATAFGTAFEDAVISLAENLQGKKIVDREGAYSVDGANFITCHIDGRYDGTRKNHEGKTTNVRAFGAAWGEPGTDRVPQEVQVQVQQQMMCNNSTSTIVSVLVFPHPVDDYAELGWRVERMGNKYGLIKDEPDGDYPMTGIDPLQWAKTFAEIGNFHTYKIEARPDTQKLLKEMYSDFWNKYVVPCVAPDAVDYDDIRRQFTSPKGTLVISSTDRFGGEDIADIMREYKNITKEIGSSGHLAKRKKFIKTQILKFAREQTTVEDEESIERVLFLDEAGKRLGSFNKKGFRS